MGIKTVRHPSYSPDLAPWGFWLFAKLRGCRYETIEEMKEAVTKVINRLTQEDFHGAFQKLLERYNKCIAAGGDYFEGDYSFMSVLSMKASKRKKSGNLFNDPRICLTTECRHFIQIICTQLYSFKYSNQILIVFKLIYLTHSRDPGIIVMKEYSRHLRVPYLEIHLRIQFTVILRTISFLEGVVLLLFQQKIQSAYRAVACV